MRKGGKNEEVSFTCNVEKITFGVTEDNDPVERPKGYTQGEIEVIDFIEDQGLETDHYLSNIIEYICRCKHKGTMLQDLKKARWYLNRKINNIIRDEEKQEQGIIMAKRHIETLAMENEPSMVIKKKDIIKKRTK